MVFAEKWVGRLLLLSLGLMLPPFSQPSRLAAVPSAASAARG